MRYRAGLGSGQLYVPFVCRSPSINWATTLARRWIFLQLDAGSHGHRAISCGITFVDGKLAQARDLAQKFNGQSTSASRSAPRADRDRDVAACLDNPSSANSDKLARETYRPDFGRPDPEVSYVVAQELFFCGQKDLAIHLIRNSVAGHYCPYTGLQNDSVWAKLRGTPEFNELLSDAKKCQSDFLAQRSLPPQ